MSNESKRRRRARPEIPDLRVSEAEASNIRRVLRNMRGAPTPEPESQASSGETSTVDHSSTDERRSPTELRSQSEPRSESAPTGVQIEPRSQSEPRSASEQGSARISVEWVKGYLQIPNYILDRLLPALTQDEATVYLRLYRLAQHKEDGRPRGWCAVGAPKLMETTGIKRTALFAALAGLERKGLIERESQEILRGRGGGRGSQGNRYRVHEPIVEGRPLSEPRSLDERRSQDELRSQGGRMKYLERKDMKAPAADAPAISISELRTEAERYRAEHPAVPTETLRERLRQFAKGRGACADEAAIDEAMKG